MLYLPEASEGPDFGSPSSIVGMFCGGAIWIYSVEVFWVFLYCRAEHTDPASTWSTHVVGAPCSKVGLCGSSKACAALSSCCCFFSF